MENLRYIHIYRPCRLPDGGTGGGAVPLGQMPPGFAGRRWRPAGDEHGRPMAAPTADTGGDFYRMARRQNRAVPVEKECGGKAGSGANGARRKKGAAQMGQDSAKRGRRR